MGYVGNVSSAPTSIPHTEKCSFRVPPADTANALDCPTAVSGHFHLPHTERNDEWFTASKRFYDKSSVATSWLLWWRFRVDLPCTSKVHLFCMDIWLADPAWAMVILGLVPGDGETQPKKQYRMPFHSNCTSPLMRTQWWVENNFAHSDRRHKKGAIPSIYRLEIVKYYTFARRKIECIINKKVSSINRLQAVRSYIFRIIWEYLI